MGFCFPTHPPTSCVSAAFGRAGTGAICHAFAPISCSPVTGADPSATVLASGMDLMTLKETLGHADIKITSIYRSMSEQQLIAQQRKVNPIGQVG